MPNKAVKILVLQGGDSSEREVSFRSAAAVIAALKRAGYTTIDVYDPKDGTEGMMAAARNADVVLPIIHGENCEDGVIQARLEKEHIPFLGAGSTASRAALDKEMTHKILMDRNILSPRYDIVTLETFRSHYLTKNPYVLKTVDGGSSVDCLIVRSAHEGYDAAEKLLKAHARMILEELIEGVEITVGVLGEKALPIVVIEPPQDGEFDYENKYNGATKEICPVPDSVLSSKIQLAAQEIALQVHKSLGVRHLSRTDMIIRPNSEVVVLELNTIPGLTDQSLYPKEAAAAGITMEELVEHFVEMSLAG